MTIEEAGKSYDIAMYYDYDKVEELWGWTWAVECGYQCWDIPTQTQPSVKEISNPSSKHGQDRPSDLG